MNYSYFPGCSLKGTNKAYEESTLAVFEALGLKLQELPDWNCCGATAYMSVKEDLAFVLAARNLALAEEANMDLVVPCSGCYLVLQKTKHYIEQYAGVAQTVHRALDAAGLSYTGKVRIRHPLDVIVNDVGLDNIKAKVKRPLEGLQVAPYYGCQIVRPFSSFDNQANPTVMDRLIEAIGAGVVTYPLKTKCCGGVTTGMIPEAGLRLGFNLLDEARKRGAEIIVTTCPLCQFNLDSYQDKISRTYRPVSMPVLYFTQLLGLALGLSEQQLGLWRHITPVGDLAKRPQAAHA